MSFGYETCPLVHNKQHYVCSESTLYFSTKTISLVASTETETREARAHISQ